VTEAAAIQAAFKPLKLINPCIQDCGLKGLKLVKQQSVIQFSTALTSSLPLGSLKVRVVAQFDRDRGTLLSENPADLTPEKPLMPTEASELDGLVKQFLEQCQFEFEVLGTPAEGRPVQIVMDLDIQIL
jgi:hypothetical protein